jgi:hypothetical protein
MLTRIAAAGVVVCACAWAQGTKPKAGATEYPAHAEMKDGALGAENLGHSLSAAKGVTLVRDYLVVEVALYAKNAPVKIRNEQFLLRINGKKAVIGAQTAGMVAASLKYPDWESRPRLVAGGGIGNAGVILGQPDPVRRTAKARAESRASGAYGFRRRRATGARACGRCRESSCLAGRRHSSAGERLFVFSFQGQAEIHQGTRFELRRPARCRYFAPALTLRAASPALPQSCRLVTRPWP